jgi:hypothetical protein
MWLLHPNCSQCYLGHFPPFHLSLFIYVVCERVRMLCVRVWVVLGEHGVGGCDKTVRGVLSWLMGWAAWDGSYRGRTDDLGVISTTL